MRPLEEPRQLRTQLPEVYIGAYIREPMASALIEQINTVSKLTRTIKDEKSRADLLSAQAVSIREQIMNVTLTSSDCDQLVEAIDQSDFSDESKTELGKAVLQQLGKAAEKVPKRSNQTVEDLGPFLTTTDVEMLTNVDMTLLSKVQRLATVLARIGCMNPTEPTYGKALTLLKKRPASRVKRHGDCQRFTSQRTAPRMHFLRSSSTEPSVKRNQLASRPQ